MVLINNLFYGNDPRDRFFPTQIFITGLFGPFSGPISTITEINNTIYGRGQELIYSFGPSIMANNVFVNDSVYPTTDPLWAGLSCDSFVRSSPIDIRNNDIFTGRNEHPDRHRHIAGRIGSNRDGSPQRRRFCRVQHLDFELRRSQHLSSLWWVRQLQPKQRNAQRSGHRYRDGSGVDGLSEPCQ